MALMLGTLPKAKPRMPAVSVPRVARPEPLENGDWLSAGEFLRRYEAMPQVKKAELIEGVVYMGSPVRITSHGAPDNIVQTWLGSYSLATPGTQAAAHATVRLDMDNIVQPDCFLRIHESCGGQARLDEDEYLVGAPELVFEVAASSASIDLRDKQRAYRRAGVMEYLVWRTMERGFDWFRQDDELFVRQEPDPQGIIHSTTFPGLVLNVPALLALDGAKVLATLQTGLKHRLHKAFVQALRPKR